MVLEADLPIHRDLGRERRPLVVIAVAFERQREALHLRRTYP